MAWVPLESNPDVMNKFISFLGVPEKWKVQDVIGLDPELLGMIPRPTIALILLFPCSPTYEELRNKQEAELKEKGLTISDKVFFMKQHISNACGTIALIHSIANNEEQIQLSDGFLKQFLDDARKLNPTERGDLLMANSGIANTHSQLAQEGQTEAPPENEPIIHHFVSFVHVDGSLYELDGRKAFPINHGPTSTESFVEDAAKAIQEIMKKDPTEMRFTVCSLSTESSE